MGEIVNYMQLDTSRMEQVIGTIHVCWDGPLQVLVSVQYSFLLQLYLSVTNEVHHAITCIFTFRDIRHCS